MAESNTCDEDYQDMNMITEYFERTAFYQQKYGPKTIVLMQCGTFYEVYAYHLPDTKDYQGGKILEFSQICNMAISKKALTKYKSYIVSMAGFQYYSIETYVQRLVDHQYTVVEITQENEMQDNGKKRIRKVNAIYSPGTHLSFQTSTESEWSNYIMSVWIHRFRDVHIVGASLINNYTGQSHIMEHKINESVLQSTSFDELDGYIAIYSPKEIILVCDDSIHETVSGHMLHQKNPPLYFHNTEDKIVKNAKEQIYRQEILSHYFGKDALQQCAEFSHYELATQSFCILMNFLEEHNPKLCKNIQLPICEDHTCSVKLANHTLHQLNILENTQKSDSIESNVLQSVHSWMNKCKTVMGKRSFREILSHPIYDEAVLNREYDAIDKIQTSGKVEDIRKQLREIHDIHALTRKLLTSRLYPSSLYTLFKSIESVQSTIHHFHDMPWIWKYLQTPSMNFIQEKISRFLDFITGRLHLEQCSSVNSLTSFEKPILKKGHYPELDALYESFDTHMLQLQVILDFVQSKMEESGPARKKMNYVKHQTTEKTNHNSIQMTAKRGETFLSLLKPYKNQVITLKHGVEFKASEVSCIACATKSHREIHFPLCTKICQSLGEFQGSLNNLSQKIFADILREIEGEYLDLFEECCRIIAKVDILVTKGYISQKYNYCRPEIDSNSQNKSYLEAHGLRHILIEQLNTKEIYVTNDLVLGKEDQDEKNGMLLFGVNTSGKTSLMRAAGIAVIMAQTGMYVPCQRFVYKPYRSVFSRILNQDNLFKGLSTFAVEMSELRVILKYADENSLILGDELCSGTETVSALSIMMSSLLQMNKVCCSFMFTTHFHEIVDMRELQDLSKIQLFHLTLSFNRDKGILEYDRKLKPGSGPSSYGLEVCESLYMDRSFLERAYEIRRTHFPEFEGSLRLSKCKYNAKKLKTKCEKCGKLSDEIHHIHPQKDADEQGFIESFHKNNPANLMALCEACHLLMHHEDNGSMDISSITTDDSSNSLASIPEKKVVRKIVKRKVAKK